MATINLARRDRAARPTPGAGTFGFRHGAFDRLPKAIDPDDAIDLTRPYFGLPSPAALDWVRDPFHTADQSFSMVDNKREVAVLAACLLDAGFEDGKMVCALAPLTVAAGGARKPAAAPDLLSNFEQRLQE